MLRCILLFLLSSIAHAMDKPAKVYIKTFDSKKTSLTTIEKGYSARLTRLSIRQRTGSHKKFPIRVYAYKKELELFQKLLHKPLLFHTLSENKYYKALAVAAQFESPHLYAELLCAKMPSSITNLIAQKYLRLNTLRLRIFSANQSFMYGCFIKWTQEMEEQLTSILAKATLPQAIFLMQLRTDGQRSNFYMEIMPHMPCYEAFNSWNIQELKFLMSYFPINPVFKETQFTNYAIESLEINGEMFQP